jgi:hypothetical protein
MLQELTNSRGLGIDLKKLERVTRADGLRPADAVRLARKVHAWRQAMLGDHTRREK